jgi:glycogen(starch) synthase
MLRVLMFGWEFPPHISGGLGTACHGLTQALVREQVKVTLVVPRLTGDEDDNGTKLLDASKVKINPASQKIRSSTRTLSVREEYRVGDAVISVVEVPSKLSPYNLAHLSRPVFKEEDWKQSILRQTEGEQSATKSGRSSKPGTYPFVGGYGQQLIEEVGKYAEVAREIARSTRFDVIHAHDWMTFPAGIAAKEVSGKPLVLHVHATEQDRAGAGGSPFVYAIEREALKKCDKAISVSNWTRNILATRYGAPSSTLEVVHNGVINGMSAPVAGQHPLASSLVTFLGRVTYQKGPEYFVEAAQKTLAHLPDCHFVMAGSGDALPRIINSVAAKGMSRNFHFTGFLKKPDIDHLLSLTKVYVMPSVSEPFGITPLEAIQAGVPVIISKQSGVSEVMPHALKVDYWDTDALSQAMCSVLQYKSLSNVLKRNSAERIGSISWEAAAKKVKQIYYETVSKN